MKHGWVLALLLSLSALPGSGFAGISCGGDNAGALVLTDAAERGYALAQPDTGEIQVGEQFALSILLCGKAGDSRVTAVDAQMPKHGHGMNYRARVAAGNDGDYTANGMILHMPGDWRLIVDVEQDGQAVRYSVDIKVAP